MNETRALRYASPLGEMLLAADGEGLVGLWFTGQRYFPHGWECWTEGETPALRAAERWLDVYFSGKAPSFTPPINPAGTAFQREVWDLLTDIPYGGTVTYGELAQRLARRRGLARMPAQAVGSAVGRNPISVIIPCHRVVGADGSLTGYAGGMERKAALLKGEGAWRTGYFIPAKRATP